MNHEVAHQFDDAEQQFEASNLGMWVFLATEVLFFGGLFAGYVEYRFLYPTAWKIGSAQLDLTLGVINTAVLLLSSLTMALAVYSAQTSTTSHAKALITYLICTMILGSIFLGIKFTEYHHKFEQQLVPGPRFVPPVITIPDRDHPQQLFFSFYFAMTGVHALHMIIGIGLLLVLATLARRGRFSTQYYTPVEIIGLYWHFVDVIWVFLFPLFYLVT